MWIIKFFCIVYICILCVDIHHYVLSLLLSGTAFQGYSVTTLVMCAELCIMFDWHEKPVVSV